MYSYLYLQVRDSRPTLYLSTVVTEPYLVEVSAKLEVSLLSFLLFLPPGEGAASALLYLLGMAPTLTLDSWKAGLKPPGCGGGLDQIKEDGGPAGPG